MLLIMTKNLFNNLQMLLTCLSVCTRAYRAGSTRYSGRSEMSNFMSFKRFFPSITRSFYLLVVKIFLNFQPGVGIVENSADTQYPSVPKNFFLTSTRYPSVPKKIVLAGIRYPVVSKIFKFCWVPGRHP